MDLSQWFDDLTVAGKMPPEDVARKLQEMGDDQGADTLRDGAKGVLESYSVTRKSIWSFFDRAWTHTAHVFGYIPLLSQAGQTEPLGIQYRMGLVGGLRL